ncbi:hypothetical protein QJS10_CPB15g01463 [Acorus calamus]|uniref:Uncharacterized protein n=1 Tax=Acorus calamus TaxID=4465 RepID=A0AAV9D4H7_ACOCL|nr:hypothetical protein QJS10_CPB15g01463 [Acorus calamus]
MDSNDERLSIGSRTSGAGRRSRRNSTDSSSRASGRSWNKKLKVTSQHPFKLRTERRVKRRILRRCEFRGGETIPIAQGLPWTTEEPQCLVKPPPKERTEPIDLVLHSDVRAVERAGFDQHVCEATNDPKGAKIPYPSPPQVMKFGFSSSVTTSRNSKAMRG